MVGLSGFEPPASRLSGVRSNQLSYRPCREKISKKKSVHYHFLRRKEVIQPHVPVRLPCYDFAPVTDLTFNASLPLLTLGVRTAFSGTACFHGVTGGVYKTRERIHRGMLIRDYWRFRLHVVEFQTTIRTEARFVGFLPPHDFRSVCTSHCRTCVALDIRAMMT